MRRWYERFSEINQGRIHDKPTEVYLDEVYAFYQNCYHLKDWIKNDTSLSSNITGGVENYINNSRQLKLCADLCNRTKHLQLNHHRSTENPEFGNKHYSLTLHITGSSIVNVISDHDGNMANAQNTLSDAVPPTLANQTQDTPTISLKYNIQTNNIVEDAFDIASQCIRAWDIFLNTHGLAPF